MSIFKKTSDDSTPVSRAPVVTSCFLGVMGVLHFVKPEHFDRIVPRALPGSARFYTYASGVAELGVAGLLALPKTRRAGALAAIDREILELLSRSYRVNQFQLKVYFLLVKEQVMQVEL